MIQAFIALGSNLNQPLTQVEAALSALRQIPHTALIQCSPFYRTKPLGPADQPDYLNAVVELQTELTPNALLDALQSIERDQGRIRTGQRFGPRTLDLDILLFGKQTIQSERLTVPHYALHERAFMLYPLADIAPHLVLPDNTPLTALLARVPADGLAPWFEQAKD